MQILRLNEVADMTGLSRVTIWRMERAGKFPERISLSPRRVGWRRDEVHEWLESRPRVSGNSLSEGSRRS